MKIKSYRELNVWKKGIEIVDLIYMITENFPKTEIYGLSSHMQRTAISIPSNIAEGFARQHSKEYKQFCYVALGSCAELETQVVIAKELKYIDESREDFLNELIDHICRMIVNLNKRL